MKSPDEGRALLDALRGDLVPVDVEGTEAWLLAEDAELPDPAPSVRLLPHWDCYVLGFREHARRAMDAWRLAVASLTVPLLAEPGEPIAFACRDERPAAVAELLGLARV